MARLKIALIILVALALAAGCYKPPKKQRDEAKEAKRLAQMADAPTLSANKYDSAEDAMSNANSEYELGGKKYRDAKRDYIAARNLYDQARMEAEAAGKDTDVELTRPPDELELAGRDPSEIFIDVLFDYDDYSLRSDTKRALDDIAQYLIDNKDKKVTVEGHCDERGTEEYNIALGERRAKSVRDYLTAYGVSNSRIKILSKGEFEPVDPGHNENAWSQNRRGHFLY